MKYTHIIWDFNGTILDDVQIGIEAINRLLSRRGLKKIDSIGEYRSLFCFPIKKYYARCGFDFERDDYESVLAPEWVDEYNKLEGNAALCDGVLYALRTLRDAGISQSILSASLSDMLMSQVSRLNISRFFTNIVGCDDFFAYGKTDLCKKFVGDNSQQSFLLVGDTTHDYEVALAAGIDCVLICQGHMDIMTLEQCGCPVFEDARQFSDYILSL